MVVARWQPLLPQGHVALPQGYVASLGCRRAMWHCRKGMWQACVAARVRGIAARACGKLGLPQGCPALPHGHVASLGCRKGAWHCREDDSPAPLPAPLLPQIALDVARALVYLHSRKIVHCERSGRRGVHVPDCVVLLEPPVVDLCVHLFRWLVGQLAQLVPVVRRERGAVRLHHCCGTSEVAMWWHIRKGLVLTTSNMALV